MPRWEKLMWCSAALLFVVAMLAKFATQISSFLRG
jgi:hypothetical protein